MAKLGTASGIARILQRPEYRDLYAALYANGRPYDSRTPETSIITVIVNMPEVRALFADTVTPSQRVYAVLRARTVIMRIEAAKNNQPRPRWSANRYQGNW